MSLVPQHLLLPQEPATILVEEAGRVGHQGHVEGLNQTTHGGINSTLSMSMASTQRGRPRGSRGGRRGHVDTPIHAEMEGMMTA